MTQLFPNPSVAVSHRTGGSGSRLKLLRLIAMLSLLVATEAAAQAPRMPAPMPLFRTKRGRMVRSHSRPSGSYGRSTPLT